VSCPYVSPGLTRGPGWVAGGRAPGAPAVPATTWRRPWFADVRPEMRIFREEIFGPVVCVTPFEDEGPARSGWPTNTATAWPPTSWTRDLRRGHRVAAAVDAGMLWLNPRPQPCATCAPRSAGVKASGLGREGGQHSLDFYTDSRIVHVALEDARVPRFGTAGSLSWPLAHCL